MPRASRIEPEVKPRSGPRIWFVHHVEVSVSVDVGEPSLVPAVTPDQNCSAELAFPVAVQNPRRRIRMIRFGRGVGPLRHLGREDVQIPVAIHISDVECVTVNHIPVYEIPADPGFRPEWIPGSFVEPERTASVPGRNDDLGLFATPELPSSYPSTDLAYLNRFEYCSASMFEPVVPRQQVQPAIPIDIECVDAFGLQIGCSHTFSSLT